MRRTLWSLLLFAFACDPAATAESRGGVPAVDRRSREYETCSRTADCADELRCFDGSCRRVRESVLGELRAAVGDRAMVEGRAAEAATAYEEAVAQYDAEKLEVPPELLCSQARAILQERSAGRRRVEIAARLLHRCLLGAPVGSSLRDRALADLAAMLEHGLDPALVSRAEVADAYLTQEPAAPDASALDLAVQVEGRSRSNTFKRFTQFLQESPEVKAALVACWKQNYEQTREPRMSFTLPFRFGFALDENDDFSHSYVKVADAEAPAEPAAAAAASCARAALDPLVEAEGRKMNSETRWDASATFMISPTGG